MLTGLMSYALKLEMSVLAGSLYHLDSFALRSLYVIRYQRNDFGYFVGSWEDLFSGEFAICNKILASFHCAVLAFDAHRQTDKVLGSLMAIVSVHLVWDDSGSISASISEAGASALSKSVWRKNWIFCWSLGLAVCLRRIGLDIC